MYSEIEFLKFVKDKEYAEAVMKDETELAKMSVEQLFRLASDARVREVTFPYFLKKPTYLQQFNKEQLLKCAQYSDEFAAVLIKDALSTTPVYCIPFIDLKDFLYKIQPKTQLTNENWIAAIKNLMANPDANMNEILQFIHDDALALEFLRSIPVEDWLKLGDYHLRCIMRRALKRDHSLSLLIQILDDQRFDSFLSEANFRDLVENITVLSCLTSQHLDKLSVERKMSLLSTNTWLFKAGERERLVMSIPTEQLKGKAFTRVFRELPEAARENLLRNKLAFVVAELDGDDWFSNLAGSALKLKMLDDFLTHKEVVKRAVEGWSTTPDIVQFLTANSAKMTVHQQDVVADLIIKKVMQVSDRPTIEKYAQESDAFARCLLRKTDWQSFVTKPEVLLIKLSQKPVIAKYIKEQPELLAFLTAAMQKTDPQEWRKPIQDKYKRTKPVQAKSEAQAVQTSRIGDYDFLFKIKLIGDSGVGKSSLLLRYTEGAFHESYISTIGVDFKIRYLDLAQSMIAKLQIWDTAGQERFRTITSAYSRGAHAFVILFDITDQVSFNNVLNWRKESERETISSAVKYILVGTKSDLEAKRVVKASVAEEFARQHGMQYFETSAKANKGIDEAFQYLVNQLVSPRLEERSSAMQSQINICYEASPFAKIPVPDNKDYSDSARALLKQLFPVTDSKTFNEQFMAFFQKYIKDKRCDSQLLSFCDALRKQGLTILEREVSNLATQKEKIAVLNEAKTMALFAANWGGYWFADTRGITAINTIEQMRQAIADEIEISRPFSPR